MGIEIISRFKDRPKTRTAWRAMGFGLGAFLSVPFLGMFTAVIRPLIDRLAGETAGRTVGFGIGFVVLAVAVLALVFAIRAFRLGERSWVMWTGFVPAVLIGLFWIFMIIGELLVPH